MRRWDTHQGIIIYIPSKFVLLHFHNHSNIFIYFAIEDLHDCYAISFSLALVKAGLTSLSHIWGLGSPPIHSFFFSFCFSVGGLKMQG